MDVSRQTKKKLETSGTKQNFHITNSERILRTILTLDMFRIFHTLVYFYKILSWKTSWLDFFPFFPHMRNRGLYEQMKKGYLLRRSMKTAIISKERTQNFKVSLELLLTIIYTNVIKLSMTGKRFVFQGQGFLTD